MKKLFCVSVCAVTLSVLCVRAMEAAPVAVPQNAAPAVTSAPSAGLKEITLTGTITKRLPCACVHVTTYFLTGADGTAIKLPAARGNLNLDAFVGAPVTLTGMGGEQVSHGKKTVFLRKVTAVVMAPRNA